MITIINGYDDLEEHREERPTIEEAVLYAKENSDLTDEEVADLRYVGHIEMTDPTDGVTWIRLEGPGVKELPGNHVSDDESPKPAFVLTPYELRKGAIESLEECGGCGCYHRRDFGGDCRDDAERFPVEYLPHPEHDFTPKQLERLKERPLKQYDFYYPPVLTNEQIGVVLDILAPGDCTYLFGTLLKRTLVGYVVGNSKNGCSRKTAIEKVQSWMQSGRQAVPATDPRLPNSHLTHST